MQQAFNIRIQDSGIEDGDLETVNIPKETFGLAIPQVLSESEKACMKNSVNTFMATRFSVRPFITFSLNSMFAFNRKAPQIGMRTN